MLKERDAGYFFFFFFLELETEMGPEIMILESYPKIYYSITIIICLILPIHLHTS